MLAFADDQEVKPPALTKEQEERNQKRLESFKNSQYQLKLEASRAARKGEMDRQMQLKIVKGVYTNTCKPIVDQRTTSFGHRHGSCVCIYCPPRKACRAIESTKLIS